MPDQPHPTKSPIPTTAAPAALPLPPIVSGLLPPGTVAGEAAPAIGVPTPVNELTPEEQMALFEKELKEKDWGHQPC